MAKSTGISFVIKMEIDGVLTQIGGQRGATFNRSAETTDRTTKDTQGYKVYGQSFKEWSIEADGLLIESDAGWAALEEAFETGADVEVEFVTASGAKYQGSCIITDLPVEAPYDDEATYSVTLQGNGAYTKVAAPVTP